MMNYIFHAFIFSVCFYKFIMIFVDYFGENVFVSNIYLLEFVISPVLFFLLSILILFTLKLMKKISVFGKIAFEFNMCNATKMEVEDEKI